MTKVTLTHESGLRKGVKCGFSWTTFFFGFLVPLIRGDWKWTGIILLLQLVIGGPTAGVGAFIVSLIFCFIYNKIFIKELLHKGYKPETDAEKTKLVNYGVL